MFRRLAQLIVLVESSCEVFKTIITPDLGERLIEQDLSSLVQINYAWGVWTKYSQHYVLFEDLALQTQTMHILTEKQQDITYLVYYITLSKEEKSFTHSLYLFHGGTYQIRELQIDQYLGMDRWVFFYFCYQESFSNYNIFLYIQKDDVNVQMIEGGPFVIEIRNYKEYVIGGQSIFTRAFESSIKQELKQFSGQISSMDLREGLEYYYSDIPTFLDNIELDCQVYSCEEVIDILIISYMKSGSILRQPISYYGSKFMISGWVIINELAEQQNIESVLLRATLRYTYFQDKYQGDKALYWKYIQSSLNQNLNGFQITTYHYNQSEPLNQYQTQERDSWLILDPYYFEALTFWHWFVYQEGVDGTNNIRLTIYFGHGKQEKIFTMKQQHQDNAKLYFNIGGDNYNQNFNGQIRDLTFKYCYDNDTPNQKLCHISCKACYGPLETHCLTCEDASTSKRELSKSQCLCQEGYIDIGNQDCKIRGAILKNINIQEAIAQEDVGCQRYQFQVIINGNLHCLDCPGKITPFALYCIDCIQNPNLWYLNPICTTDYLMPFTNDTNYVFLKKERKAKDFQYYLINFDQMSQHPFLETCFGCFQQSNNSTINFIQKFTLDRIQNILCKNCYRSINGECIKFNMNCNQCDDNQLCITCEFNYTLFENQCLECPIECPNCKYNSTGYYCNNCITGYYFNSTLEQCQQCGQFCKVCIFSSVLNNLQCLRCIHDTDYFISVEKLNCRKKSLPNCELESSENYLVYFNQSYIMLTQQYSNSLDVVAFKETIPTFQICMKCENGYINKLLVQQHYECVTVESLSTIIPEELKVKVLESQNNNFQLALISKPQAPQLQFQIIYGDRVNSYSTLTMISNPITGIFCDDPNCLICVNNYIQEQQYCMQCYNGYYSNTFLGRCYQCPSSCSTCLEQSKIYQDAWKWQYKINYHFRSSLLDGQHSFNVFGTQVDPDNLEVICTSCPSNGILYNNKCYPKCNCDSCIIEDEIPVCISCKSLNTKTVYDGQCHLCPKFCELCREITQEEKLKINPYFQPTDITLQKYAQQCIKRQSELPAQGILYYDPTLGYEINCLNLEKKNCYLFLEIPINIYCSKQTFDQQYNRLETLEQQDDFLSKNALISNIFSTNPQNHFSVETDYLFHELNLKSVKLVRYILNLLPSTQDCIINKNSFISSNIRQNVFTVQFLELIFQSSNQMQIYMNDNVTLYEFTTVSLKNLQIIPISSTTSLNINNIYGGSFLFESIKIKNINENQFRIQILNPNSIIIKNFQILDSKLINLNGILNYKFTQQLSQNFVFKIDQLLIQNCQIINSKLIVQILDVGYGNQQLQVYNFKSSDNVYESSVLFYTEFNSQIREALNVIEQLNSENDNLTNSSLIIMPGALSVELVKISVSKGNFYFQTQLFKLPLFTISNMLILNNNFNDFNTRVITNRLDTLYKDNIQQNLLKLNQITFQNNNYVGSQVFIELIESNNFQNLEVHLNGLTIQSNLFTQSNYQGLITSSNSSLYFDLKQINIENVKIIRAYNLPEISINNAQKTILKNVTATLDNEFKINLLHQYVSCFQKNPNIGYGSMLQIYNSKAIQIDKLEIIGLIAINSPIIIVKSLEKTNIRYPENIEIISVNLINNTIILSKLSEQPSVISIISEQEQKISLKGIMAFNNHHHSYQEDQQFRQSSTIYIENPNSEIILRESIFSNNVITNNQGSNLVLISANINILDCSFNSQNDLQYSYLKDRLIWGYQSDEIVYIENLYPMFPINSKGGNAYFQIDSITLRNVSSYNSLALQGGAFYFLTQSNGRIVIEDCNFNFSQTNLLMKEKSQGGTLLIDASQSDLNLIIQNNTYSSSFSRQEGGAIFIEPSRVKNSILITKSIIQNVYSLANAFLKLPIIFTSNTLFLDVRILDLSIQNTYQGFLSYLGRIRDITQSEINFQTKNYLISIERGNITIKDCNIINLFDYGVLEILNAQSIKLENILMENFTLISGSILKFELNNKYMTNIEIFNVKLMTLQETIGDVKKPISIIPYIPPFFQKCFDQYTTPNSLQQLYDQKNSYIISLYNFYALISKRTKPAFIFQIDSINLNHFILIQKLHFQNIICSNCKGGLLRFTKIEEQLNQNLVYLQQIKMEDNICGIQSCLIVSSKDVISLRSFSQISSNRVLNEVERYYETKPVTVKIESSYFKNNTATYGGAVLISSISILITSCQFKMNQGKETGGAIYLDYHDKSQFLIFNTLFENNQANVGGAIFLENFALQSKDQTNIVFQNNKASLFSNNVADFPIKLSLKFGSKLLETKTIENKQNQIIQIIDIKKYYIGQKEIDLLMLPSGQAINEYQIFNEEKQEYIPLNLSLRIIPLDKENSQIKALDGSKCTLNGRQMSNNLEGEFQNNFISLTEVEFNTTSQDYNLDTLIVNFDPDQSQENYLQLEIMCNSIKIPIFDNQPPYLLKNYETNYKLRVNLQTFPCQRGEYKTQQGTCKLCDPNSYQYNTRAGEQCKIKDQIKMEKVSSARIMLRQKYWRPYENSENIEYCLNLPENCIGGWNPGNDLCSEAHIGALCEQCDLYNIRGQGSFSVSTIYKCGDCQNIGDNTIKVILISIWTMISIFLSVKGTIETVNKFIIQQKRIKLKIASVQDPRIGQGNVLIKVLTNYFQIIGVISTFQLQLPSVLQSSVRSVGNPTEAMSLSLDCFLIDITDIDIIYFRMIWALIMPLIYMLTFIFIYMIVVTLHFTKLNKSAFTTTAIYLFTYLQPTLIGGFISLMSFRYISNYYWIQGNVAYRYDTQQHFNWILTFILPSILCLGIIIPAYLFINLYRLREQLEQENTRKNFGYLYNEYSKTAYFWEIIKILQKGFIIIFLTFYEDLIIIKGALVFIIVFIYQLLTRKYRPYQFPKLNLIDELSTLICGTSIVLSITIYQANISENQEIILPFYICLILLNGTFIFYILWGILQAQLEDQQENLDKIRDKINKRFPKLIQSSQIMKKLLTNKGQQHQKIKLRYQKIKVYLLNFVHSHPGIYDIHTENDSHPEQFKPSSIKRNSNFKHEVRNLDQKPKTKNKVYPIDFEVKHQELKHDEKNEEIMIF
ncbi:unnamed protein product [Paramecium sonneborni]|uniref:Laminin EGF-like domain-containing protein n=1 Tax=Paramecium sonneborni TaxID=65129 RepID=A0A8S1R358_9CILI|nr:unnamed protein product [Paramecium sonneborni]